jgi:hypothetical protein
VYVSTSAPSSEGGDEEVEVAILRDWARSLLHLADDAPGALDAKTSLNGPSFTMTPAHAAKTLAKPRSSPPTVSEIVVVADDNDVNWLASKSFLPNSTEGDPLEKFDASYVDPVTAPEHALN